MYLQRTIVPRDAVRLAGAAIQRKRSACERCIRTRYGYRTAITAAEAIGDTIDISAIDRYRGECRARDRDSAAGAAVRLRKLRIACRARAVIGAMSGDDRRSRIDDRYRAASSARQIVRRAIADIRRIGGYRSDDRRVLHGKIEARIALIDAIAIYAAGYRMSCAVDDGRSGCSACGDDETWTSARADVVTERIRRRARYRDLSARSDDARRQHIRMSLSAREREEKRKRKKYDSSDRRFRI